MGESVIELKNITKIYKGKRKVKTVALDDVSFSLPDKGFIFVLGKSGCGKSTLLNLIGGLDKPTSGDIIVNGKSTKKFRNKDFDYYRNTYVGFIFQDFNLLEEYSVYDNISLALRLQRKKEDKEKITKLLEQLELIGLEKRKMNELSGGQKQRVAIGRAMIKNPEILLADEPTGSLDEATGQQIFELLKQISKEKLVVVVTHDREAATNYADYIIELKDGKVISNNTPNNIVNNRNFISKKSKLPFSFALKMAFRNLSIKKIRLFFTVLLLFFSLSFFGISELFSMSDLNYVYANTMVEEKESNFSVAKGTFNQMSGEYYLGENLPLTEKEINDLQSRFSSDLYPGYQFIENNLPVSLQFNQEKYTEERPYYYSLLPHTMTFIPMKESDLEAEIIGRFPEASDEILIHEYLAEQMMYFGVEPYATPESILTTTINYYYPSSVEQLLKDEKYLKLGSNKVKVVGVIKDNLEPFNHLKKMSAKDLSLEYTSSFFGITNDNYHTEEFLKRIINPAIEVYVSEKFVQDVKWQPNQLLDNNYFNLDVVFSNKHFFLETERVGYLDHAIQIYNGQEEVIIQQLKPNEIVLSESYFDDITNHQFQAQQEQYINNYQQLLKDNTTGMEYKTNDELKQEFLFKYISENNIIGSTINLRILDTRTTSRFVQLEPLIVKGIMLNTSGEVYFGSGVLDDLLKDNYEITYMYGFENDFNKFKTIFTDYTGKEPYVIKTVFSDEMQILQGITNSLGTFFLYASLIFGCFALLLLINFITMSIYNEKKKIGILRALGARSNDIFKIFLYEGIIIGLCSLLFVLIGLFYFKDYVNQMVYSRLFFHIEFLQVYPHIILLLFITVLTSIFAASLFTVHTISRLRPVDVILNRKQ